MDEYISRKAALECATRNYYPSIDYYCRAEKVATRKDLEAIKAVEMPVTIWHSFPNEKPPENETVWIWIDVHDWPAKGYYSHGSWYYTMTGCMVYDGTVTHWMPIPPPPTKPKGVEE